MEIKKAPNSRGLKEISNLLILLMVFIAGGLLFNSWTNQSQKKKKSAISLNEAISIQTLLNKYKDQLIFISANDDAANKLDKQTRTFFAERNGTALSQLAFRASYAGIVKGGNFVAEKMEQDAAVTLKYENIKVSSGGLQSGNFSRLEIADDIFDSNKRGLNVFIFDKKKGNIFLYSYDFFAEATPLSKGETFYFKQLPIEQLRLTISAKDYQKLEEKRTEAFKSGILLTSEADLIPAKIDFQNQITKSEIRLKGDWTIKRSRNFKLAISLCASEFRNSNTNRPKHKRLRSLCFRRVF